MARYRGPKSKIARKFKEPIFGPSKALDRKKYGPGQHGRRRKKVSEYAVQLNEKQKAKYTYGLLEKQFRNTFDKAARKKGVTGEVFLQMLESRLDNVVYRMGFAPYPKRSPSIGDSSSYSGKWKSGQHPFLSCLPPEILSLFGRKVSTWIWLIRTWVKLHGIAGLDVNASTHSGVFLNLPNREEIPETINEQLIVELYSKG